MISVPGGVRVYLALGRTGPERQRRRRYMRKGFDGLALQVQEVLKKDPYSGHLFLFRGRRGDRLKILYYDTNGLCLFAKRLQRGRFVWPISRDGVVTLTPAQLSMLVEGLDWRAPDQTWRPPALAG
jgi:transposase